MNLPLQRKHSDLADWPAIVMQRFADLGARLLACDDGCIRVVVAGWLSEHDRQLLATCAPAIFERLRWQQRGLMTSEDVAAFVAAHDLV